MNVERVGERAGNWTLDEAPALRMGREARARSTDSENQLNVIYEDASLRIASDRNVRPAQAEALASRIEAAYRYDLQRQKWDDPTRLESQLTVAVLSRERFSAMTGDTTGAVAGFTTGPNLFVVPEGVLGRRDAADEDTLAHELAHVQDFRQAGDRMDRVPIFLLEGKAYLLGDAYPATEHLSRAHQAYVARALAGVTAAQAKQVLDNFRSPEDEARAGPMAFYGETVGALFVEFLRTRLGPTGQGKPDAIPRLADIVYDVGQGADFDASFRAHFGVTLGQAETQFLQYMKDTEGQPAQRFARTLYATEASS